MIITLSVKITILDVPGTYFGLGSFEESYLSKQTGMRSYRAPVHMEHRNKNDSKNDSNHFNKFYES